MAGNPLHAWQILFSSVLVLASGTGTIQERLAQAYDAGMHNLLAESDLPHPIKTDLQALASQIQSLLLGSTRQHPLHAMRDAILRVDPRTAAEIARRIVATYDKIKPHRP